MRLSLNSGTVRVIPAGPKTRRAMYGRNDSPLALSITALSRFQP